MQDSQVPFIPERTRRGKAVRLLQSSAKGPIRMRADASSPHATSERRVLAVEDDPDILRLIRRELEGAGFVVWPCLSAEDGLATVSQRGLPHLALVDILLPGI